jgi:hypothetical protein
MKIMDRPRILIRALEIKFKGWRQCSKGFSSILEDIKKRRKN